MGSDKKSEEIMTAAVSLAVERGYMKFSRAQVASRAQVSEGLVSYYYSEMANLRTEVVRYAIRHNVLPIVAAALVTAHPLALEAPLEVRKLAAESLLTP